jgi:hypothetical protein
VDQREDPPLRQHGKGDEEQKGRQHMDQLGS